MVMGTLAARGEMETETRGGHPEMEMGTPGGHRAMEMGTPGGHRETEISVVPLATATAEALVAAVGTVGPCFYTVISVRELKVGS